MESARRFAAELIALAPDVILATGSTAAHAVLDATRIVPIVFVGVTDPAGAGFVSPQRLSRACWRSQKIGVICEAGFDLHERDSLRCIIPM